MKKKNWVFVIFLLSVSWSPVLASEIVVDPGGSGDAPTIQGGLNLASDGDLVTVMPGTYTENLIMVSGVRLISADGPESTIINGNNNSSCIDCEQCGPGSRISGFTFTNGGGYIGGGVRLYDHTDMEIDNNIFLNNRTDFEGAGISVQLYSLASIHDNRFHGNVSLKSAAISVIENAEAHIADNFFKGNFSSEYAGAIGVNQSTVNIEGNLLVANSSGYTAGNIDIYNASCEMRNNTFIRNYAPIGASCLKVAGSLSTLIAENNLFAHNGGGAPAVSAYYCYTFSCNIFWANGIDFDGQCNPLGQNGNAHIDAGVCDPLLDDGAVSEFSPCLIGPCDIIGANPTPGCVGGPIAVETQSWGSVKSMFR